LNLLSEGDESGNPTFGESLLADRALSSYRGRSFVVNKHSTPKSQFAFVLSRRDWAKLKVKPMDEAAATA
jgi:hypothetical protein